MIRTVFQLEEFTMNDRIARLIDEVKRADIFPPTVTVEYDPFDENLPEPMRIAKRLNEYMAAQPPVIGEDDELVGKMKFDGSVPADIFTRRGHSRIYVALKHYYNQPQENLCTMEWQHSNMDFGRLIRGGLDAFRIRIRDTRPHYAGNQEKLNFLAALDSIIRGISERALLLAEACRKTARTCEDPRRQEILLRMAGNCKRVPMHPARNFEEAVQCVYFCFPFLPDSIGRPDHASTSASRSSRTASGGRINICCRSTGRASRMVRSPSNMRGNCFRSCS